MATKREVDEATQTETTGHEWDGIKELDTPMPRWWLWTFYATIVWGVIYTILFPAWPLVTGATPGLLGYSSRGTVAAEIDAAAARNAALDARLIEADLATVENDPELLRFATAGGAAVFRNNCAPCHGAGASGVVGHYPNLLDDDWLWGGTLADIQQTVSHGVRFEADADTRFSQMPAFGEMLAPEEIDALTAYVLSLSGQASDAPGDVQAGAQLFADNCSSCHGEDGTGGRDFGAPNLADGIWLYGGDAAAVHTSISDARFGIMPAFGDRLRPDEIAKVAVYVHTLGGGE
ncbi:cytochrome-c oxidase, cbb3-type subunit III [Amaricoccus sp.]|uniref:cytochrome-c oxidase, cbb3-type subunit III n=1 Tax=Amaricoccus sp. TaxID=1872485 RepID=UPI002601E07B|nr:cytochrome-c oxidase, cbb3-type subunit III [Amaricoccus sp.]HRO12028.1 cytochrome-c oxidase, cbb3-type subunit III [Amaricoccus sp.]